DHGAARARPMDGRVVPRTPSGAAERLAGRRPGPPQGGAQSLRCRRARARRAAPSVREPVGAVPPDGLAGAMTTRRATEAHEAALRELWEEFEREVPWDIEEPETWADEWPDTLDDVRAGGVFLAEDEQGAVGVARVEEPVRGRAHVQLVHVRERGRRQGLA